MATNKPRGWALLRSLLAAAFGVQSRGNLEQDFRARSPWPFVIGGVVATVLFVLLVWGLVNWVLERTQIP